MSAESDGLRVRISYNSAMQCLQTLQTSSHWTDTIPPPLVTLKLTGLQYSPIPGGATMQFPRQTQQDWRHQWRLLAEVFVVLNLLDAVIAEMKRPGRLRTQGVTHGAVNLSALRTIIDAKEAEDCGLSNHSPRPFPGTSPEIRGHGSWLGSWYATDILNH